MPLEAWKTGFPAPFRKGTVLYKVEPDLAYQSLLNVVEQAYDSNIQEGQEFHVHRIALIWVSRMIEQCQKDAMY